MANKDKSEKRILITGGHGMVGQTVYRYLKARRKNDWIGRFKSKAFDLTDRDKTQTLFKACAPDVVIHLAAKCGGIGANMQAPAEMWASNLIMAVNVLDCCLQYGVKKLITLGTVCSYPRDAIPPFKETDLYTQWPEITNRPYGVAKLAIYEGCRAYHVNHGLNFTYLIPTNMYGPGDHYDLELSHVIPAMIRKFHEARLQNSPKVIVWGDGSPSRDFLYVSDCARAIDLSIDKDTGPEPINLGNGKEITMAGLAEAIAAVVGYTGDIEWDKSKPNGQPRRAVDSTRAKAILGWEPTMSFFDGLKFTYDDFVKSLVGSDRT